MKLSKLCSESIFVLNNLSKKEIKIPS